MPGAGSVFISHISEDAEAATWLKSRLDRDYLNIFEVFASSDAQSVAAGQEWVTSVREALNDARVLITLCSPSSIRRPWINFEIGAAWILDKGIVPLCYAGLTPRDLPIPLSLRQGLVMTEPDGLRRLYAGLAETFGCGVPDKDFDRLAAEARQSTEAAERSGRDDAAVDEVRRWADIGRRARQVLDDPRFEWRTLKRVAAVAGVTEEEAADVLRADPEVRFGTNRAGEIIVGRSG
jgi:hypothetical protein